MSTQKSPARPLVVLHSPNHDRNAPRVFGAVVFSFLLNGTLVVGLMLVGALLASGVSENGSPINEDYIVQELPEEREIPLDVEPIGLDPTQDKTLELPRVESDTFAGPVDPTLPAGQMGDPRQIETRLPTPAGTIGDKGAGHEGPSMPFPAPRTNLPHGGLDQRMSGATKKEAINKFGGSPMSEAAVARGLRWLADHQSSDGRWSFEHFHRDGKCNCTGQAKYDDVAATALGVLPFLGAGYTHKGGNGTKYTKHVENALKFLLRRQNSQTGEFDPLMYSHALATMAICEAYGLTSDPTMKRQAQRALDYIVDAQSAEGGWRYTRRRPGFDTSVSGWQLMALKSGQMAGLYVPTKTLQRCKLWLDAASMPDGGAYGYDRRGEGMNTTAVGLLCQEYLGWGPRNPGLRAGIDRLQRWHPQPNKMYFSYYATQVMHHAGGAAWDEWNKGMRESLIDCQDQGKDPLHGHQAGSWYHPGCYGGRLMETSLSILTLEVYYRFLPLYNREAFGDKELLRNNN